MGRIDLKKLAEASSTFGEAVVDPGRWTQLIETICEATGTTGAALMRGENRTVDSPKTEAVEEIIESYFENNLHLADVRALRGVPLMLAGRTVVRDQDIFQSEKEMLRDPLYANLSGYGFRWFSAVGFKSGNELWALSFQRTVREGAFDNDEIAALSRLSSSMTAAATLSRAVGEQVLTGVMNAFGLIKAAAISITHNGAVIEANPPASALFDAEFKINRGRLYMRDEKAFSAINDYLRATARFGSRLHRGSTHAAVVVIRRSRKRPLLMRLLPVPTDAHASFLGARAILLLKDLEGRPKAPEALLGEIFALSPAEARVASMLAVGLSVGAIADELSLAKETIRNQLKAVFAKTGTHRQHELAILISKLVS